MCEPLIFQYDKWCHFERLVKISDVCWKKNLYEVRNISGCISDNERNVIEKYFSLWEKQWDIVIQKLVFHEPLSDVDKQWILLLVALQLLRTPEIINRYVELIKSFDSSVSDNDAERFVRLASFIHGEASAESNWLLDIFLSKLSDKHLVVYYSDVPFVLNGSRPVMVYRLFEFFGDSFLLPVARNVCIGLLSYEPIAEYFDVCDECVFRLNYNMFLNDGRFVYSFASVKGYDIL